MLYNYQNVTFDYVTKCNILHICMIIVYHFYNLYDILWYYIILKQRLSVTKSVPICCNFDLSDKMLYNYQNVTFDYVTKCNILHICMIIVYHFYNLYDILWYYIILKQRLSVTKSVPICCNFDLSDKIVMLLFIVI